MGPALIIKDLTIGFGSVALILFGGFAWACLWGLAFMKTWLWFVCPLGVRPVGLAQAVGISFLLMLVKDTAFTQGERDWVTTAALVVKPGIILFFGWCLKTAFL